MSSDSKWLPWFAAFGLLFLCPVPGPRAAGFDCSKATTPTERLICGSPGLSEEDSLLAGAYQRARARLSVTEQGALTSDQRNWLKSRDLACIAGRRLDGASDALAGARECLSQITAERIVFLTRLNVPATSPQQLDAQASRGNVSTPPRDCPAGVNVCFWQGLSEKEKVLLAVGIVQGASAASWAEDAVSEAINRAVQTAFRKGSSCESGMTPMVLRSMIQDKLDDIPKSVGITGAALQSLPLPYLIGLTLKGACQ